MKSLKLALVSGFQIILLLGGQFASAQDTNFNDAEALLDAMRARESYAKTIEQFTRFLPDTVSVQQWYDRIYNDMARIYSEVYTAEELQGIRSFYESPVGQAFLNKRPHGFQMFAGSPPTNTSEVKLEEAKVLFEVMRSREAMEQTNQRISRTLNVHFTPDSLDFLYRRTIETYAGIFTLEELRGIRSFYESPAGQAFVDKRPLLIEKHSEVMQNFQSDVRNEMNVN